MPKISTQKTAKHLWEKLNKIYIWRVIPCSWIEKFSILKIPLILNLINMSNSIQWKAQHILFGYLSTGIKIYMKMQNLYDSQENDE